MAPYATAAALVQCAASTLRRHRCTLTALAGAACPNREPIPLRPGTPRPASAHLRAGYTALNDLAALYTMLHAAALALGDPETASIARRLLGELTPLVFHFSRVLPCVVAAELAATDPAADASAGERSRECTQTAWSRGQLHAALADQCDRPGVPVR